MLQSLDGRTLKDIGIDRSEIEFGRLWTAGATGATRLGYPFPWPT